MTTKTTMALADVVEKGADSDLLRDMIQYVAQRLMELDTAKDPPARGVGSGPLRYQSVAPR